MSSPSPAAVPVPPASAAPPPGPTAAADPADPATGGPVGAAEAPSGKGAATENFPVGSFLLPPWARPHVAVFYAFARAIDDVGDAPDLSPAEKIARLEGFEAAVTGRETRDPAFVKGHRMRESLRATLVTPRHCVDLIAAFKQDAVQGRYADWDDLMGYCFKSASPVGRYLIDLHGGCRGGYGPSDALCNALQVINHVQDCQDDYRTLDRVYLPQDWMAAEGARVEDLDGAACTPGLRRVLDRCLDGCRALLEEARALAPGMLNRRLGLESAVIVTIAETLVRKLSRHDPVAGRVRLSKVEAALCAVRGVARGMAR
ncbi:squalene synthase HpnC [Roseospira visakhapatnamensis]|uniref:Squalene synthase HpnC n=1 Tax=Roseospira visakhapatnamensis TaxID=390880 RepID=A0A7W6RC15_9PROT|nr:squalene synthase HpnC [Roseospira visakhapatnamensis]MBB4265123.1 squalene synthase HpnC [Roseospira visakhapatnamensis]